MQNNLITLGVAALLLVFLVFENSLPVRVNIVAILGLLFILGFKINDNLDRLAQADRNNAALNQKLQQHAVHLEDEVRARTQQLQKLLITDELTGLINRREFENRLRQSLSEAGADKRQHVLCLLDLDRFKIINDTCGHAAGDELLQQLTPLLLTEVRDADSVARFGGDEFAILFRGCALDEAVTVAERIRVAVEEYRFSWNNSAFSIGVSIGVIGVTENSGSLVDVLAAADDACYRAKELGRNRIHVYEYDAVALDRRHREMQWATRIAKALEDNRFVLNYQAIVPTRPNAHEPRHFEVLVRMLDESRQLVPPGEFLPAAERFNLMPRVDRWVIRNAFKAYAQLSASAPTALSINLSGNSFTDHHLLVFIQQQLDVTGVPPENIVFEITETAAIANLDEATALINGLRKIGCRFALDDFGSGLSSFGYLKNLPVDHLKIDGSFVKDMLDDETCYLMVELMNHIGHALGKKTVAEFVENEEILQALQELHVDYAQGYGVGRPVPLEAILDSDLRSSRRA